MQYCLFDVVLMHCRSIQAASLMHFSGHTIHILGLARIFNSIGWLYAIILMITSGFLLNYCIYTMASILYVL